jgi:hypothetical protein
MNHDEEVVREFTLGSPGWQWLLSPIRARIRGKRATPTARVSLEELQGVLAAVCWFVR